MLCWHQCASLKGSEKILIHQTAIVMDLRESMLMSGDGTMCAIAVFMHIHVFVFIQENRVTDLVEHDADSFGRAVDSFASVAA